ncbi:MAG TPA: endonuclease [Phycisphaerales bacterium]|nr:endonuclease [Phycisphaerales bacterium]
MLYYVYILQSLKTSKLYIGHTDNLARRFEEHNTGRGGKYTRQNGPWKLVHSENHPNRSSAANRERYLKSTRGSQEKKKLASTVKRNIIVSL